VGGDLDVAFVPNYALYQQAEQSIKTSGQGIDLLAYQVGRNGSSNTFWLVTTQHGGGLSNYLITFFQANSAN
jgi:hypothetical protein